eukprot:g1533.t1
MVASGTSATPPVEQWERVMTFSGHGSDVLDVAWARGDRKIASCSVDGTVRIWEVTPETLQLRMCEVAHMTLSGHSNWVRGLAWDPVGTYLASAGDDRTVHVWRTSDWKVETIIHEPFEGAGGDDNSFFRRISWCPDGKYICVTNAVKGPRQVASIVTRGKWTSAIQFVGHESTVVASSFCGRLFAPASSKGTSAQNAFCYCAVASMDSTVSIWSTNRSRPLVIVQNLFERSVSDIAWNNDNGKTLFVTGTDGTLACLHFGEGEIGVIQDRKDQKELLRKLYGEVGISSSDIIESTAQLKLEQSNKDSAESEKLRLAIRQPLAPEGHPVLSPQEATIGLQSSAFSGGIRTEAHHSGIDRLK